MTVSKNPTFLQSLIPVIVLIVLLFFNVMYFDETLGGANQTALIIAATIGGMIGWRNGVRWASMQEKILHTIHAAMPSILILFLIGALSGSWMISGVIPLMIYYGVDIMHPAYFLLASVVLCGIVSLATGQFLVDYCNHRSGDYWDRECFSFSAGLVAGAVISGAYFGDKMSPLSDTTNLAPAVAGTDVFTHIRYLVYTTGPTFLLTLLIFGIIGIFYVNNASEISTGFIKQGIAATFNTNLGLLFVPVLLIFLIIKKVPPIPVLLAGTVLGILFSLYLSVGFAESAVGHSAFSE